MKRYLSAAAPAIRLTIWKVLTISLLTAGIQVPLLLAALRSWNQPEDYGPPSLEVLVQDGRLSLAFGAGLLLVCAVMLLPGLERGAKTGYTLRRLMVDERSLVLVWGGVNGLLLLIFWGVQTAAALALSQYYLQTLPAEFSNHQSLFLAFSRSPYLHALLPLWDWPLSLRNVLGCAVLGLAAAILPFHWRHGRKAWIAFPLTVLGAFTFPVGLHDLSLRVGQLILLATAGLLTGNALWRRYDNED